MPFILRILVIFVTFAGCLPVLRTLHLSHNRLKTIEDIEHLKDCPLLSIVDVSHNQIEDEEVIEVRPKKI
jgi:Leucine Rich Repeat.